MNRQALKFYSLSAIIVIPALCNTMLADAVPGNTVGRTPIIHGKNFQHERELFNYNPKFYPNVVSFDKQNRPYLRTRGKKPVLETIDAAGKWHKIDFCKAIKKQYPGWNSLIATGTFTEERVAIDNADNIYLLADLRRSNLRGTFRLTSANSGKDWSLLKLPGRSQSYFLEAPNGNNDKHGDGDGFNLRSAARYYMVFPRVQTNWMGFRIVKEEKND